MRRVWMTVVVATAVAAVALPLTAGGSAPRAGGRPAPAGLPAFYSVPRYSLHDKPGTVLKYVRYADPTIDGTTYRVMYLSQGDDGTLVPVTGYVVIPPGTAPTGGWPVLDWSHGTNGMSATCAPSLDPGSDVTPALINLFLAQGWAFTASDYEGEGAGPTLMPYLVGASAAVDSINIVRAAHRITALHTSTTYVEWGHSEGGQTAAFVDHLSPTYAPDLTLKGTVAGAPPSQFAYIEAALQDSPYAFYLFMAAGGYHSYYGEAKAPITAVLTAKGRELLPDLAKGCYDYIASTIGGYISAHGATSVMTANAFSNAAWKKLLAANDPESFAKPSSVPLLIIQGGADEEVPVVSTALLYSHLCAIGQVTQRWIYPGESHTGVISVSYLDMIHWIADRFAGGTNPDPYVPTGLDGVTPTTQTCN